MANHLRRQIRDAVAAAVTGLATTGSRVFKSRVYPLDPTALPALVVTTLSETCEVVTIHGPRELMRVLSLRISAVNHIVDDLDDTLDQMCKEVEIALAADITLGGLCKSVMLNSTEIIMTGDSEKPTGQAVMQYAIDYYAMENAPDVAQ